MTSLWIVVRGGGDLASGVALRLHRAGLRLLITELAQPLVVRRRVAFAEAIYEQDVTVEGLAARRVEAGAPDVALARAADLLHAGTLPVLVDPDARVLAALRAARAPIVLVDARMMKRPPELGRGAADLVIGLGPGFTAGLDCDAVIETNRGHCLGRVIWNGAAEADTGLPEGVANKTAERVLRAPVDGILEALVEIGQHVESGQPVAHVNGAAVSAVFPGVVRGLARSGLSVTQGVKIGDIDPRDDPRYCFLVSDKSLAVGGGVLEALLAQPDLRPCLWNGAGRA
jgi:xanthine dehydrogenase accessory factor